MQRLRSGCSSARAWVFSVVPGCPQWLLRHRSLQPPGGPPVGTVYWCLLCWNPLPSSVRLVTVVFSVPLFPQHVPSSWLGHREHLYSSGCFASISEGSGHCLWFTWPHTPWPFLIWGPEGHRVCCPDGAGQGAHLRHLWCTEKPGAGPAA